MSIKRVVKKRSEMSIEELVDIRAKDAAKARKRRALKGDIINKQRRANYKNNESLRKKILLKNHSWRKANFFKVYARRKETGETRKARHNWYHKNAKFNLNYILGERLRQRTRRAIKADKKESAIKLCGCTIDVLIRHLENQFKYGMNWGNYGYRGWHIDHIKPCASFDLTDQEQQKKCFHYTNLQPLWAYENFKKGCKHTQ